MSKKNTKKETPQQCKDTAEAFIVAHGLERAIKVIENNIKALNIGASFLDETFPTTKIQLAVQSDFWTQSLDYLNNK